MPVTGTFEVECKMFTQEKLLLYLISLNAPECLEKLNADKKDLICLDLKVGEKNCISLLMDYSDVEQLVKVVNEQDQEKIDA